MDFVAHYRRAVELAEDADKNYADSLEPVTTDEAREDCLRRAEVLARMSQARAQLAWVAYMGADAAAEQALTDDVRDWPTGGAQVTYLHQVHPGGDSPA